MNAIKGRGHPLPLKTNTIEMIIYREPTET